MYIVMLYGFMGVAALRGGPGGGGATDIRIITMGLPAPLGLGSASGGSSRRAAVWCVCGSGTCDLASDLWVASLTGTGLGVAH